MKCQVTVRNKATKSLKDCEQGVYIDPGRDHLIYFKAVDHSSMLFNTSQNTLYPNTKDESDIQVVPFVGTLEFQVDDGYA